MNQLADNKKLMDFLLYSYFGFSSGDLDQTRKTKVFVPCIFRLSSHGQICLFFSRAGKSNGRY